MAAYVPERHSAGGRSPIGSGWSSSTRPMSRGPRAGQPSHPTWEARGSGCSSCRRSRTPGLRGVDLRDGAGRWVGARRTRGRVIPSGSSQPLRSAETGFSVVRAGGRWESVFPRCRGQDRGWVRQTDFTNDEAVGYLADRLQRAGSREALLKAGAVADPRSSSARRTTPSSSTGSRLWSVRRSCTAAVGPTRAPGGPPPAHQSRTPQQFPRPQGRRHRRPRGLDAERRAGHWDDPSVEGE